MRADAAVLCGGPVSPGALDLAPSGIPGIIPQFHRGLRGQPPTPGMNAHVWIVDDEAPIRSLLTTVLEKSGYQVTELADASSFKEKLSGDAPDVILLDLKLPDADGLDLL